VGRELLRDYADLVSWGEQAGALALQDGKALRGVARRDPGAAKAALSRARSLRETLFGLFSGAAGGRTPDPEAVARLHDALQAAAAHRRLVPDGTHLRWRWSAGALSLDRLTHEVAISAVELLTSPSLERVRECQAPDCAWLFLDASRNGSRRWCDMSVCGNRAKVRRFRGRSRSGEARSPRGARSQAAASRAKA
jgi:predicted RNA-binding Zn ribbon-like protein